MLVLASYSLLVACTPLPDHLEYLLTHLLVRNSTSGTPLNLTADKEHQRRNTLNMEAGSCIWLLINVDLDNSYPVFKLFGKLLNGWSHSLARATPISPEINKNRQFACSDKIVK